MNNVHVVVMAGGLGKRLWPLSNQNMPKQFMDVFGCGRTLIQLTLDRLKTVCNERNIWVVTAEEYEPLIHKQLPQVRKDHILLEPMQKNTTPAIAYFTWKIKSVAPNATVVITNCDQMVTNYDYFANAVKESIEFATKNDAIVTLGVKPDREEVHGCFETLPAPAEGSIYKASKYLGRPAPADAMAMPNVYWNTSLKVATVKTIEESYRKYAPEIAEAFDAIESSFFSPREGYMINELLDSIEESISYERSVLLKADNVYVYAAEMGWSDLSAWSDLLPFVSMARYGNLKVGNVKAYNCSNCIIEVPDLKVAVVDGLEDFIVAEKDGQLLICRLSNEKRIKDWSAEIEGQDQVSDNHI